MGGSRCVVSNRCGVSWAPKKCVTGKASSVEEARSLQIPGFNNRDAELNRRVLDTNSTTPSRACSRIEFCLCIDISHSRRARPLPIHPESTTRPDTTSGCGTDIQSALRNHTAIRNLTKELFKPDACPTANFAGRRPQRTLLGNKSPAAVCEYRSRRSAIVVRRVQAVAILWRPTLPVLPERQRLPDSGRIRPERLRGSTSRHS